MLTESILDQHHIDEKLSVLSFEKQLHLIYEWTKTSKIDKKMFEYAVKKYLMKVDL